MKRSIIGIVILLAWATCASAGDEPKSFSITVDPSDAAIKVISGTDLKEQQYKSPAGIQAFMPKNPDLVKRAVIEISREGFKRRIISLANISDGEVLKVTLEKQFLLKFRMVGPQQSDDVRIRDGKVSIELRLDEEQLQMSLKNNTPNVINILWQRASYTDVDNRTRRIMHSGIPFEDRHSSFPLQKVLPYVTLHQALIPVDSVAFNPLKKTFEMQPLFPDPKSLNGKEISVVIPIEIEAKVVPYSFKIKVIVF